MSNHSGKAYGLMVLCPLKSETGLDQSPEAFLRDLLNDLPQHEQSRWQPCQTRIYAAFSCSTTSCTKASPRAGPFEVQVPGVRGRAPRA